MGKGDFIIEQARRNPNINFIGIEKFDSIVAKALPKIPNDVNNLYILCFDALFIDEIFKDEISSIFLNFSDPWHKKRHHSRRLTSKIFLDKYDGIIKDKAIIYMKTDHPDLFSYSVESLSHHGYLLSDVTFDLHRTDPDDIVMTEYETKFIQKGNPIYYMKATKWKT